MSNTLLKRLALNNCSHCWYLVTLADIVMVTNVNVQTPTTNTKNRKGKNVLICHADDTSYFHGWVVQNFVNHFLCQDENCITPFTYCMKEFLM